jgi:hypothetical protein
MTVYIEDIEDNEVYPNAGWHHLGARNTTKAFHQNIGHFHCFLSEMYNSKY